MNNEKLNTAAQPNGNGSSVVPDQCDSQSMAAWVKELNRLFVHRTIRTLADTLALAKVVYTVRSQLRRGEWSGFWKTDQLGKMDKLEFCKREADMLVTIGRQWEDLNEQTFAQMPLPAGWSTLYLLAQLDRETFLDHIGTGKIHRKLTGPGARELLDAFKGRRSGRKSSRSDFKCWLRQCIKFANAHYQSWSLADQELARVKLAELLEKLTTPKNVLFPDPKTFFTTTQVINPKAMELTL